MGLPNELRSGRTYIRYQPLLQRMLTVAFQATGNALVLYWVTSTTLGRLQTSNNTPATNQPTTRETTFGQNPSALAYASQPPDPKFASGMSSPAAVHARLSPLPVSFAHPFPTRDSGTVSFAIETKVDSHVFSSNASDTSGEISPTTIRMEGRSPSKARIKAKKFFGGIADALKSHPEEDDVAAMSVQVSVLLPVYGREDCVLIVCFW